MSSACIWTAGRVCEWRVCPVHRGGLYSYGVPPLLDPWGAQYTRALGGTCSISLSSGCECTGR